MIEKILKIEIVAFWILKNIENSKKIVKNLHF